MKRKIQQLAYDFKWSPLWMEVRSAYQAFCEDEIEDEEIARRWLLVVHLVHNFKSNISIGEPQQNWSPLPERFRHPLVEGDESKRVKPPLPQQEIVDRVEYYRNLKGFGIPITSALCALVKPDEDAIIDRFTYPALVGGTGGSKLPLGVNTNLGAAADDRELVTIPDTFQWTDYESYRCALRRVADSIGVALLHAERAMFMLGQRAKPRPMEPKPTWGEYRERLVELLSR